MSRLRHTAVADLGLDRPDEFVLHVLPTSRSRTRTRLPIPGAAVGRGRGDLRRRELRFENGDAQVDLCLLLEQVEQRRIAGEVPS